MTSHANLRQYFPIFNALQGDPAWIYLDSAATSQKPQSVIDAISAFYTTANSNVHRASHNVARQATDSFEQTRVKIQQFINAASPNEVIWTKGATESINLVANILARGHFKAGDEILLSALEHHANIVPWQQVAAEYGLTIEVIPVDKHGVLDLARGLDLISAKTALLAIGHVSNALGNINPLAPLIKQAKQHAALILVDGAQAIGHMAVDVQALDCDFYLFSGHKMYGPTGTGVLYGKEALLNSLPPYQGGGEMIEKVSFSGSSFQLAPFRFEAGTPNIAGVMGLSAAVDFIQLHRSQIAELELYLYQYLHAQLRTISGITLWGETTNSSCIQSFTVEGVDNQDLGMLLNEQNIAVRLGHHCAMPLMEMLGLSGTLRVSLACYNTTGEIDAFIGGLNKAIEQLKGTVTVSDVRHQSSLADSPLAAKIRAAKSWDETYRQIMLAGKSLSLIQSAHRTTEYEVFGCESQVWLCCEFKQDELTISAYSPSKIVRGLLAIMFEPIQGLSRQQVETFDMQSYLAELGLAKHLSQSRGNGLSAVMSRIKQFCG